MKSIIAAVLFVNLSRADWKTDFVDFWPGFWCDLGHIYNFDKFACVVPVPWSILIPSSQRTNNTGGFNLKAKITTSNN